MTGFLSQNLLLAIIGLHLTCALWSASWYAVAVDEPAMLGGGMWTWQTRGSEIYPLASLVLLILVSSMGFRTFWRYSLGHLVLQWARRNPEKRPLYCELPARYGLQPNPYFPQDAVELTTLDAELVADGLPTGWYVLNLANRFQTHWRRILTDLQAVEELGDNYGVYYVPRAEQVRSAGNVDVPPKRPMTR